MKNTNNAITVHPEYKMYQKNNTAYCSSLQVAEAFGKRHDNILADIEKINLLKSQEITETLGTAHSAQIEIIKNFFRKNFIRSTYTDARGRKQPMYLMTRTGFTVLVNGYSGEKAMYFKILYAERFDAMEAFIKDYIFGKEEFPIFTQAIADAYENPQPYHYSNEMNMIYRIVLGMDAKTFREAHGLEHGESIRPFLSEEQQKAIRKLQTEDIRMLYRGIDYQERKTALTAKTLPAKLS